MLEERYDVFQRSPGDLGDYNFSTILVFDIIDLNLKELGRRAHTYGAFDLDFVATAESDDFFSKHAGNE